MLKSLFKVGSLFVIENSLYMIQILKDSNGSGSNLSRLIAKDTIFVVRKFYISPKILDNIIVVKIYCSLVSAQSNSVNAYSKITHGDELCLEMILTTGDIDETLSSENEIVFAKTFETLDALPFSIIS